MSTSVFHLKMSAFTSVPTSVQGYGERKANKSDLIQCVKLIQNKLEYIL